MKSKLLALAFIAILLYSALGVAVAMAQAPGWKIDDYCNGTGKISTEDVCPTCLGSGSVQPNIVISGVSAWKTPEQIYVRATVENKEARSTHGTFTATLRSVDTTYEAAPKELTLSANEVNSLTFTMGDRIPVDVWDRTDMTSARVTVSGVANIICPTCDGNGVTSVDSTCPVCGGTGFVPVEGGSQNGGQNGGQGTPLDITGPAIGVGVAAAAGVAIASVVVVKRRKVSEKDLRKLSPTEFQSWVLKKLAGKAPSPTDSRIGIDGYTTDGQPISIKQSEGVGRDVIEKFAAAIGQSRAKNGILVAYSYGSDAYTGKVRAKLSYGLEIQLLTVKDLIESKRP